MEPPQYDHKKIPTPTKPRKHWYTYIVDGLIVILAIGLSFSLVYGLYTAKAYKIPSGSMEPTLLIGDHIITLTFFSDQKPGRGDIVVFPFRQKEYVKRIVGLPGETLEIRQQQVYINNKAIEEPYTIHTEPPSQTASPRDNFGPTVIPDDYVFVLGDNRENSADSRHFGPFEITDITRKVKFIYWSWSYQESTVRWERIGASFE